MRRFARVSGLVIGVLGIAFVVRELAREWDALLALAPHADIPLLALALVIGLGSLAMIGLAWRRCLVLLDVQRPPLDTLMRYYVGQLGKYVPGGIWPVVGRAEMARRVGVPGVAAYGSTVLSMGLTYLAAVLTALGALLLGGADDPRVGWLAVLALLPVGLIALHPRVVEASLSLLRRMTGRELAVPVPRWGQSIALLVWHVPAWLGVGAATWLIAVSLDPGAVSFGNLLFATTLSWVVGFLAVGVPGGIGVREAVFVVAATSLSTAGIAAAVAVAARVAFILADVIGAGITTLLAGGRRAFTDRPGGG